MLVLLLFEVTPLGRHAEVSSVFLKSWKLGARTRLQRRLQVQINLLLLLLRLKLSVARGNEARKRMRATVRRRNTSARDELLDVLVVSVPS